MILLNTFDLVYDETGLTPANKFPTLTVGPITLLLQVKDTFFIAVIRYNHASEWLSLSIRDQNDNVLQGETYVAGFPSNLIFVDALINYGLFYYPAQKKFKFYEFAASDNWYNAVDSDEEQLYYSYYHEVFV